MIWIIYIYMVYEWDNTGMILMGCLDRYGDSKKEHNQPLTGGFHRFGMDLSSGFHKSGVDLSGGFHTWGLDLSGGVHKWGMESIWRFPYGVWIYLVVSRNRVWIYLVVSINGVPQK